MTELATLFDCPRFGPLTHKACLRRQTERQELVVTTRAARTISPANRLESQIVPASKKTKVGPPVREYCASGECETGRSTRAAHPELLLEACSACGSALFAGAPCELCAGRAREKAPARQASVTKAPLSVRVWDAQPEVPLVPPSKIRQRSLPPLELEHQVADEPEAEADAPSSEVEKEEQPEVAQAGTAAPQREREPDGPSAPAPPVLVHPLRTTSGLIGELVQRLERSELGKMPDGLPGGREGSTARLAVPRLTPMESAVMTDRTCRCGCTRMLRKNNTTGWSGYCNPKRYASGDRPARGSEDDMPRGKRATPMTCCGSMSHRHKKACTGEAPAAGERPEAVRKARARLDAVRVLEKRAAEPDVVRVDLRPVPPAIEELTDEQLLQAIEDGLGELARRETAARKRCEELGAARARLEARRPPEAA